MMRLCYVEDSKTVFKRKITKIFANAFLWIMAFFCIFPFILLVINASRSNAQLQGGFSLIPRGHFFTNLANAWNDTSINMGRGLINSFFIASMNALLTTYFSIMTAFAIHVYDFKGRKYIRGFILAIMMIPTQVSTVGFVQLVNEFGLTNNYLPLIIPSIASPLTFFYMIQYMKSALPIELIEAARVDGSNEFKTFNKIAIPIMKPAMAVQAIFAFVGSWNNYFLPALLISEGDKKTLPVMIAVLRAAANSEDYDLGKIYMFVLISILPVILVYLILSKQIIKGVSEGAVK